MAKHRARNAKGHFLKGHHSGGSHSKAIVKYRKGPTVVKYKTRAAPKSKRKSHRKHRGGGGMNLTHLALAGAGLAFLTGASSPIQAIPTNVAKIPGAKTFGNPAMAGLVCLGVDRFVKRNKWLRAAGVIGVVLGAVQVGTQGTSFKWLGDPADDFVAEVGDQYDEAEG